jgi:hypothetical protein
MLSPNMKAALAKGWIEKRGAVYYVVPHHREELDAAFPGDSIYGGTSPAAEAWRVFDTHDDDENT